MNSRRFRGVSRKKGRWEAKVMVSRKWAYRELFNSEETAGEDCGEDCLAAGQSCTMLAPSDCQSMLNSDIAGIHCWSFKR